MKLNKKFILTFILFLFVLLFFNINNVFASFNFTYDNVDYTVPNIPDDYEYFLIYKNNSSDSFYLLMSDYPIFHKGYRVNSDSNIHSGFCCPGNILYYYVSSIRNFNYINETSGYLTTEQDFTIFYANHDIYYRDINNIDTLLFHNPVVGVVIPSLETVEQIPQGIAEALIVLIPVGLVVLAIGLLIYLIKRTIFLRR